jgi:hypothetical protein
LLVELRLISPPAVRNRQKVDISPGFVAVARKEMGSLPFHTLSLQVTAYGEDLRSIQAVSERRLRCRLVSRLVREWLGTRAGPVVDGGNEPARDGFEGS